MAAAALIVVDCIPTEVWTDVVLQFLATPDDLAMLAIALGPAETVAAMAAAAAARAVADAAKAAASAAKVHADKLAAIPSLALAAKLSAGARFVGVMSDAELAWFAAHGIAVALLVECHTVHHPQIIPGCMPILLILYDQKCQSSPLARLRPLRLQLRHRSVPHHRR